MNKKPVCITPKPDDYDNVVTVTVPNADAATYTFTLRCAPIELPERAVKPDPVPAWVRKECHGRRR